MTVVLMATVYRPLVQYQPSITEVSEQLSQFSVINGRPWRAAKFGQFSCGEPRNFASWPVEFGKIFCGKLWTLHMTQLCKLEVVIFQHVGHAVFCNFSCFCTN